MKNRVDFFASSFLIMICANLQKQLLTQVSKVISHLSYTTLDDVRPLTLSYKLGTSKIVALG